MGRRLTFLALGFCVSCGQPPPPAPSAVINASPEALCYGDTNTQVVLDASGSAPRLTLVPAPPDPGEAPLQYQWSFSGDGYMVDDGDPATSTVTVNLLTATRPLHVTLRVQNGEGGVTEALKSIAITLPDPTGHCPLPTQ